MKTNNLKWKVLMLLLLFASVIKAASGLTVIDLNGVEKQFALSQLGKITFNNGIMYLYDQSNTLLGYNAIDNVGQIVVVDDATSVEAVSDSHLRVFADPAQQQIVVSGLEGSQTLRVYDTSGKLLLSTKTQADQSRIDVSTLSNGTYLLQFGAQVVKFVKQ